MSASVEKTGAFDAQGVATESVETGKGQDASDAELDEGERAIEKRQATQLPEFQAAPVVRGLN